MIKRTKRIHQIWKEGAHEVLGHKLVGQWQYIYSSKKGKISLVQILTMEPYLEWEIMCQEGDLFDDVERFGKSKEDAVKRITELLE